MLIIRLYREDFYFQTACLSTIWERNNDHKTPMFEIRLQEDESEVVYKPLTHYFDDCICLRYTSCT
jgi:hypothetical protein